MGMMRAFKRMMDNANSDKGTIVEGAIGNNVGLISVLKSKMSELEGDNESLANENEELR